MILIRLSRTLVKSYSVRLGSLVLLTKRGHCSAYFARYLVPFTLIIAATER